MQPTKDVHNGLTMQTMQQIRTIRKFFLKRTADNSEYEGNADNEDDYNNAQ